MDTPVNLKVLLECGAKADNESFRLARPHIKTYWRLLRHCDNVDYIMIANDLIDEGEDDIMMTYKNKLFDEMSQSDRHELAAKAKRMGCLQTAEFLFN